ncbi:solute carrier family 12 member 8 [Tetranychus urticae]|uniref:solute carrier family 12 member 8 n=1 Tax=Tetranychus urticae TaxID=32264 RepID=UPI00077B87E3|nr:solute carrier family 12 member 8 [Tetranychus urticae]XP_025016660.1 solute carrier family 12 member 8 [Tetranychus urticae]XP_025016661.1 solute carrier family 12 member 8 [Tetranychus urticae]XP_025016662.1 solute carrier family 12 member 8 [Tetranychus urticae]
MADHDHSESIAKPGKLGLDLKATTSDSPSTFKPTTSNIQRKGSSTAFGKLFHNELFHDQLNDKPFWKANFLISEPILFGTWDGVYTSCVIHLFGVITLIRAGWIVGNAGILLSIGIVLLSLGICCIAVIAGIKITERVGGGTIHYCLSQVLGARLGGAVSLVFCFGSCVNCALHVTGFAESMALLIDNVEPWFQPVIGSVLIVVLYLINIAGVKWVVRLQFLILAILILAALDLAFGLFISHDPKTGVIGYNRENFFQNLKPDNLNLFAVFGVFFPAVTGVFAGINMSTDLYNPRESIPKGTFSAIGTAFLLYMLFMVGLGSICTRSALLGDTMIAVKASAIGYLLLAGIYISSMSSSLGSLYATPRIIQDMAVEKIIPGMSFLSKGRGPNKLPIYALTVYALLTLAFTMVRSVNLLATIVTIPYLMTFAWIEYAHFALSLTTEMQLMREERFTRYSPSSPTFSIKNASKNVQDYGTTAKSGALDQLFPERTIGMPQHKKIYVRREQSSPEQSDSSISTSPGDQSSMITEEADGETSARHSSLGSISPGKRDDMYPYLGDEWNQTINRLLSNKFLSLFGALVKVILMFLVHWLYSIIIISITAILWLYIGHVNKGVYPGVSQVSLYEYFRLKMRRIYKRDAHGDYQHFVVTTNPDLDITASQLTQEGTDFAAREKYHQITTTTSDTNRYPPDQ